MTKKRGSVPFPHVCTKNVCYCYVDEGYYGVGEVVNVIEDRYGGYPVRFVRTKEELEGI